MKVTYSGLKQLTKQETTIVKALVLRYMKKLDRSVPGATLRFHGKLSDVGGRSRNTFTVHLRHGKTSLRVEAEDWDLQRTVHKVMKKLTTAVEHALHQEGQPQQKFHPKKAKRGFGKHIALKLKRLVRFP